MSFVLRPFTVLFAILLVSSAAFAESYFVTPVTGGSLGQDEAQTVFELVKSSVIDAGASLARDQKSANAVLEPKVLRLGSTYILTISKVQNGSVVFQQQARSKTIEDMDTVSRRVVRAVVSGVRVENDARVNDVTEDQEKRGTRRIDVVRQWIIAFGPSWMNGVNKSDTGTAWTLGYSWGIDETAAIRLGFDWGGVPDSEASYTDFNLGVDYFFTDTKFSPFVTADFGYGSAWTDDTDKTIKDMKASGFVLGVGAGMRFFRTSRVNLGVTGMFRSYLAETSLGHPSEFSLQLGLYF